MNFSGIFFCFPNIHIRHTEKSRGGAEFVGAVYLIMSVLRLTAKILAFLFKFACLLHEKGMLIPAIIVSALFCVVNFWFLESENMGIIYVAVVFISGVISFVFIVLHNKKKDPKYRLQWGARFQKPTAPPMQSFKSNGVVFGKEGENYITKPEETDGNVLIVGGVGSGKSSCIAIPTLRVWNNSVFAIDIKGELYAKTKNYRAKVKIFNPLDDNSCGYDPFFCLRNSKNPAQEARAIAQAIIPLPPEIRETFWIESAQNILTGAILHYYSRLSFIETLREIQLNAPQKLVEIVANSDNEKAQL